MLTLKKKKSNIDDVLSQGEQHPLRAQWGLSLQTHMWRQSNCLHIRDLIILKGINSVDCGLLSFNVSAPHISSNLRAGMKLHR